MEIKLLKPDFLEKIPETSHVKVIQGQIDWLVRQALQSQAAREQIFANRAQIAEALRTLGKGEFNEDADTFERVGHPDELKDFRTPQITAERTKRYEFEQEHDGRPNYYLIGDELTADQIAAMKGAKQLPIQRKQKKAGDPIHITRLEDVMLSDTGGYQYNRLHPIRYDGRPVYVNTPNLPANQETLLLKQLRVVFAKFERLEERTFWVEWGANGKPTFIPISEKLNASSTSLVHPETLNAILAATNFEVQEGQVYEGKVTKVTDFGMFVEIFPGTEGLVHMSEVPKEEWQRITGLANGVDLEAANATHQIFVPVRVLSHDKVSGRIRLSITQAAQCIERGEVAQKFLSSPLKMLEPAPAE